MSDLRRRIERGKKYMLWDGDCGFCSRCAEFAEGFNASGFILMPYQSVSKEELRIYRLTHHKCSHELKIIAESGRVFGGAFALNYFLWHNKAWRAFIALLYAFPILILAEVLVYRAVASNRTAIAGVLGMTACSIQKPESQKNESKEQS